MKLSIRQKQVVRFMLRSFEPKSLDKRLSALRADHLKR
jgi:hypothetical protein